MNLSCEFCMVPIVVISASCNERGESELAVNLSCELCVVATGILRLLSPLPLLYATPVRTSNKVATPTTSAVVRLRDSVTVILFVGIWMFEVDMLFDALQIVSMRVLAVWSTLDIQPLNTTMRRN